MATIGAVVVGVIVVGMVFVFIKTSNNKKTEQKTTASLTNGKGQCHTCRTTYGIRNGEYIICSNCQTAHRMGKDFIRPQFPCDGCGKIIVLRGNDAERRHGEVINAEFNRFDMMDGR